MFYEEKLINNKLMYRTVPDGVWYECSNESLTRKIVELMYKVSKIEKELEGVVK